MKKQIQIFAVALLLGTTIFTTSCDIETWCERATGDLIDETYDLGDITDINLSISADIYLKQGTETSVQVIGREDAVNNLNYDVVSGLWVIEFVDGKCMSNHDIEIHITVADVNSVKISGSGNVYATEDTLDLDDALDLTISGSGTIDLLIDGTELNTKISGSGDLKLDGLVSNHTIKVSGSGEIQAFQLYTINTDIKVSGSGDAEVFVDGGDLDARISGSGKVYYKGTPGSLSMDISGSGKLVDAN